MARRIDTGGPNRYHETMVTTLFLLTDGDAGAGRGRLLFYVILLVLLIMAVLVVHTLLERRRRRRMRSRFRNYSRGRQLNADPAAEQRQVPRLSIPPSIDVLLTLTDRNFFGYTARALDISASGLAILPAFPLKRIALNEAVHNVLVQTPVNNFIIREARLIRVEHQVQKRLLALSIVAMDDDQRAEMGSFISHLQGFLHAG